MCRCGLHAIGLACPTTVHEAMKRNREKLAAECKFIGVQRDEGYPPLDYWDCHCGGSLCVKHLEAA